MRVSVFGLGYVGAVSCGCFAKDGFDVVGVDINPAKVSRLAAGAAPIVEEAIGELIAAGVVAGRLRATTDAREAVHATDVSVVSVGTPSQPNGSLNLDAVERVCREIGAALGDKPDRHLVVIRSTVLPGTVRSLIVPLLEQSSGRRAGAGFGVCFNPEFLREGSSVRDHYHPPFTLIGGDDPDDARRAAELYASVDAPLHLASLETAEMVKYVSNAFHALKITFANEVGIFAQAAGLDSHEVMRLVCLDTKLNVSTAYLTPGFAFGGSCLPKDLRAMLHQAGRRDLDLPLLSAILPSNRSQVDRVLARIRQYPGRRVAMLGLSFKAGTDDLRESPLVTVAEALIGKGYDLRIYDPHVELSRLTGANREYIEREIPHIASVMVPDVAAAVANADIVVVGNRCTDFTELDRVCSRGQIVLDLVRLSGVRAGTYQYEGVVW
jgi:GDP-mannose 6-dehydrogenase